MYNTILQLKFKKLENKKINALQLFQDFQVLEIINLSGI